MKKNWKRSAALMTASLVIVLWASIGLCKDISGVEFKLLFKSEVFADRQAGFKLIWDRFAKVAAEEGLNARANKNMLKERVRVTRYPDTADNGLAKAHYSLRQRTETKDGTAVVGDLTLKYRVKYGEPIPEEAILNGLSKKASVKLEGDEPGFVDGEAGKSEMFASLSATLKKMPVLTNHETLAFFAEYFPVLKTLGIPLGTPVVWPERREIIEHGVALGDIAWKDEPIEIESCVWYNFTSKDFVVAELSWGYKKSDEAQMEAMNKLFARIQNEWGDILIPGLTKVAVITK